MDKQYKTEIIKNAKAKSDLFAKVEVVGDLEVGKTSILTRFCDNSFKEKYNNTIGVD